LVAGDDLIGAGAFFCGVTKIAARADTHTFVFQIEYALQI
jgi:hypothetical protein